MKSVGEYLSKKVLCVLWILWENLSAERDLFSHALVLAILRWRHAEVALRELAEEREVGEAEQLRDLLDREVGAAQIFLNRLHRVTVDPLQRRATRHLLRDAREVFRRDAQLLQGALHHAQGEQGIGMRVGNEHGAHPFRQRGSWLLKRQLRAAG